MKSFASNRWLLGCLGLASLWAATPARADLPTQIDNQATATYQDPQAPRRPLTVFSDRVTVALQEVAGITISPQGISPLEPSTRATGDTPTANFSVGTVLAYRFEVQNIGTDTTYFFVPNLARVSANGVIQQLQYLSGQTWVDVPSGGYTSLPMQPGNRLLVRVIVQATRGGMLTVSLGNVPNNGQNQPRTTQSAQTDDVYTVDLRDGAIGEIPGVPINGTREAQASQGVAITTPPWLKNGPRNFPRALGPTGDQDDFTNQSTPIDGRPDPAAVQFTNTVLNISDATRNISLVPAVLQANDLPEGTLVNLWDPLNPAVIARWRYSNGRFTVLADSGASLVLNGVVANGNRDYQVSIDLPPDTPLTQAYPLQLVAFIDTNGNQQPEAGEAQNTTINRLYTGFIEVTKESRVLGVDGQPLGDERGQFSPTPKAVQLDQYIEYRIRYRNISTAPGGEGNRALSAVNFALIEDGNAAPNNWANLSLHVPNSSQSSAGEIRYRTTSGPATDADPAVTYYENRITTPIAPGQSGSFTFRRRVQ